MNGNKIVVIVIGVFGSVRDFVVRLVLEKLFVLFDNFKQVFYVEGLIFFFFQYFEGCWVKGGFFFSGVVEFENVIELSMLIELSFIEFYIIVLVDYVFLIVFLYMKRFVVGSFMIWMLEFFIDKVDGLFMQGWCVDSIMLVVVDGYISQLVMLWGFDD